MDFVVSNGDAYRVQFVHSAHDLAYRLPCAPGGLRQLVDNLAGSLRRRVTLCELSIVTMDRLTKDAEPTRVVTPLSQGFALCHYHDQFVKRAGRALSLHRALHLGGIIEGGQPYTDIVTACGFEFDETETA